MKQMTSKNGWARRLDARAFVAFHLGRLGLDQQGLASRLGLTPPVVSRWVRGRRPMSKRDRLAIEALRKGAP